MIISYLFDQIKKIGKASHQMQYGSGKKVQGTFSFITCFCICIESWYTEFP